MQKLFLALCATLLTAPAYAQQHPRPLPPLLHDHPFEGRLFITRAKSQEQVRELCGPNVKFPDYALGCALRDAVNNTCFMVLATAEIIIAAGGVPEYVRRHEIGHCNGWPPDHPGAKSPDMVQETSNVLDR
jgi:hypothetical protein